MMLPLLPLAVLVGGETTELSSHEEVASALFDGVRSALAAGWTLVDVSREDAGVSFALEKRGAVERHVAAFDHGFHYRVEPSSLPSDPAAPSEFLLEALHGGGGIEIGLVSGLYEIEPYIVEAHAAGAPAGDLAARWIAAAEDLEYAIVTGARAVLQLEIRGRAVDLIATLADSGRIAEVELRRYEARADHTTYQRRAALVRAVRGGFVASIIERGGVVVLGTNRGRFAIDPAGDAFRPNPRTEVEGCGC